MTKTVGKGRNTWDDGSVMTYTITDDGVLTISGILDECVAVRIKSKAEYCHLVIEDGIKFIGSYNFAGFDSLEELTLPPTVERIGGRAFCACKNLKRINFSDGLVSIGKEAFSQCESLVGLVFPESLAAIGERAFEDCTALQKINIPKNVDSIEKSTFTGCSNLVEVSLTEGLLEIKDDAFLRCSSLCDINFPASLQRIGSSAFEECEKLQNVILPNEEISLVTGYGASFCVGEGCTVLGEDGNEYCCWISNINTNRNIVACAPEKLVNGDVIVPGMFEYQGRTYSVMEIGPSAFEDNKALTSVILPDSITKIEEYAFMGCKNLKSIKAKSVRIVNDQAFDGCKNLAKVDLGDSLEHIGMSVFYDCSSLSSLHLPDTMKCLGCRALYNTEIFNSVEGAVYLGHVLCGYNGSLPKHTCLEIREGTTLIAERALCGRSNIEGVILPDNMERVGYCAFNDCENLKYVKFNKSLIYIGDEAFTYTQIKEIEAPWENPIELDGEPFPDEMVVYIPKGSMKTYSKAKGWKNYKLVEQ